MEEEQTLDGNETPTKRQKMSQEQHLTPNSEDPAVFLGTTYYRSIHILQLPTEVIVAIFDKLNFMELSTVRAVCHLFREIAGMVLNNGFCRMLDIVNREMCNLIACENENHNLHQKAIRMAISDGKSYRYIKRNLKHYPSPEHYLITLRCKGILNMLTAQIRLLRAVFLRYINFSGVTSNGSHPFVFFNGKLLDHGYKILGQVQLRKIDNETIDTDLFLREVDEWINYFHDQVEPSLLTRNSISHSLLGDKPHPVLFGSKIVDLLDCWLDCEKHTDVHIDDLGWCHFTGQYIVNRTFFTCFSNPHIGHELEEPLTCHEQRSLHECLKVLVNRSNEYYRTRQQTKTESAILKHSEWNFQSHCIGMNSHEDTAYFYGTFSEETPLLFEVIGLTRNGGAGNQPYMDMSSSMKLIFIVDLKCRTSLAPVELLTERCLGYMKVIDTETLLEEQDRTLPDLSMKLEIVCETSKKPFNRLPHIYKCLIEQKCQPIFEDFEETDYKDSGCAKNQLGPIKRVFSSEIKEIVR